MTPPPSWRSEFCTDSLVRTYVLEYHGTSWYTCTYNVMSQLSDWKRAHSTYVHVFEIMSYLYTCTYHGMAYHGSTYVLPYYHLRTTYVHVYVPTCVRTMVRVLEYHGMYRYHTYMYIPITGYRLPWYRCTYKYNIISKTT